MRRVVFLLTAILLALSLVRAGHSSDGRLTEDVMRASYGGDGTYANKCCGIIENCNVAEVTCANVKDQATCAMTRQIRTNPQYSKRCFPPPEPVQGTKCTEDQFDANGRNYYCVGYYDCTWNPVTGCQAGAVDLGASVVGWLSCADNCPVAP